MIRLGLISLSLIFSALLSAQANFSGGIKGGFTASQVSGDGLAGFNKAGYCIGPFVKIAISDQISISHEILYITKGGRKPTNPDKGDFTSWGYIFHYVEVPVLLHYKFDRFTASGGLYVAALTKGIEESQAGLQYPVANPEMKKTDIGFAIGGSVFFTDHLFLEVRYTQSVSPIRAAPDPLNVVPWYDGGMYNSVLQFILGYEFGKS
jgi:hypothetical protein